MDNGSPTPDLQQPLRFEEICRNQLDRITAIRSMGGDWRPAVTALGDLLEPFIFKSPKWRKEWENRSIHYTRGPRNSKILEATLTDAREWFSILLRFMDERGWLKKTYTDSWLGEEPSDTADEAENPPDDEAENPPDEREPSLE